MKKTKSLLVILLVACMAVAMTVMFTACDGPVKDNDGNVEYEIYGNLNYKLIEGTDEYACTGTDKNNLTAIKIASEYNGKKVTAIASDAFANHPEITGVAIPESIKVIGDNAFNWCSGITEISLGNVSVGDGAFKNCTRLGKIGITAETKIGADAFYHTAYYDNKDNWESGALYLAYTEGEGESVKTCSILLNVNSDTKGTFNVKEGATAIAGEAFDGCYKLTAVTLPASVKAIGEYAFVGCSNIASIEYKGTAEKWASVAKGDNWNVGVTVEPTFAASEENSAE